MFATIQPMLNRSSSSLAAWSHLRRTTQAQKLLKRPKTVDIDHSQAHQTLLSDKHLIDLCGLLYHCNMQLEQVIEAVHRSLEATLPLAPDQEGNPGRASVGLESLRLDDVSLPQDLLVDEDQRPSYGTNRPRAGAGACELICSQAELFRLGCLLVRYAKHVQQGSQQSLQVDSEPTLDPAA